MECWHKNHRGKIEQQTDMERLVCSCVWCIVVDALCRLGCVVGREVYVRLVCVHNGVLFDSVCLFLCAVVCSLLRVLVCV
jgi:hypothetical protein